MLELSEQKKLEKKAEEIRNKYDYEFERQYLKVEKKSKTYLNKKRVEYERKCKNEIRKLEWKPEREYKKKVTPFKILEFAMELQQENSKLRDTDADGVGSCISCWKICQRWELAGWHYISRRVKNICVNPNNINAQCHRCNLIMWPLWNVDLKLKTEWRYRENLIKKFWLDTVNHLEQQKTLYFQKWYESNWDFWQWKIDINKYIEQLIEENKRRWREKKFYRPRKDWKKVWDNRD